MSSKTPEASPNAAAAERRSTRRTRFVWCLYDFGNSAYPTIVTTAVYALYFRRVIVPEGTSSDFYWGLANGLGAFFVVLAAPLLGALADRKRCKQRLLRLHVAVGVLTSAMLALTGAGDVGLACLLIIVSLYAFEAGNVFYNAFLPELAEEKDVPSLGARGWAFGYIGGLASLGVVLVMIQSDPANTRFCGIVVAAWWLVFGMPALLVLRDAPQSGAPAPKRSLRQQLAAVRQDRELFRFLVALFFYMNAVNTIFVFAVIFTSESLSFSDSESIFLILMLNVVAAPGSLLFGYLAERLGTLRSIALSLFIWLFVVAASIAAASPGLFEVEDAKTFFWGVAVIAALCIGATQATSRSYVGELAETGKSGEYFGVMAIAGRASAVLGPIVFGQVSAVTGDQRWSLASVGAFFLIGLVLLMRCEARRS